MAAYEAVLPSPSRQASGPWPARALVRASCKPATFVFLRCLRATVAALLLLVGVMSSAFPGWDLLWDPGLVGRARYVSIGQGAFGAVLFAIGAWLFWLELRTLRRTLRNCRRWLRAFTWASVALGGTAGTLGLAFLGLLLLVDAEEVQKCNRVAFPTTEYCATWYRECMSNAPCKYTSYWGGYWANLYYGADPHDNYEKLEMKMRARHFRKGWRSFDNPEHRQAVADDWASLHAYFEARMEWATGSKPE